MTFPIIERGNINVRTYKLITNHCVGVIIITITEMLIMIRRRLIMIRFSLVVIIITQFNDSVAPMIDYSHGHVKPNHE